MLCICFACNYKPDYKTCESNLYLSKVSPVGDMESWGDSVKQTRLQSSISMEMKKENLKAVALLKQSMSQAGGTTGLHKSCLLRQKRN